VGAAWRGWRTAQRLVRVARGDWRRARLGVGLV